ncbi:MAG: D-alanyl-D-alanine carboxypeptidase/D-alanyl-D-alanine-endopeptidase [Actinomycetia bacterium]|nr:D-alanyl-D-alanine carboxypeptidase/D-alanyl-D-alanine-endopeptidase [Actinomycetes bacterium]
MLRARWWVIGGLSVVTASVVLLDTTGVIFNGADEPAPAPPVALPTLPDAAAALPAAVLPVPLPPDRRVIREVEQALRADVLGSSVRAAVAPLGAPDEAWIDIGGDTLATPASTLKLWTATAVLDAAPVDQRLSTTSLWDASSGSVILVGGGDATLQTDPAKRSNAASLTALAKATARQLRANDRPARVRLRYDSTYFTGPTVSPGWEPAYVSSGVIGPVTALMVDQGRIDPASDARWLQPDAGAAFRFGQLLEDAGVTVKDRPKPVAADAEFDDADVVAEVWSPPMGDLVEQMLRDSDNQLAESLGRLAAVGAEQRPTFSGAAEAIRIAAAARGVDLRNAEIYDASGLSRDDELTPHSLVETLHAASVEPQLASILSGLPVAGFDGTLADRFVIGAAADAAGLIRAKTGTLTGISAEAGVVSTCSGGLVAYAFVADEVEDTEAARSALDDAAALLASCPQRR